MTEAHRGSAPAPAAIATSMAHQTAPRWREVTADGRLGITIGLCLVELLVGMQMLITSSTMPRVLADLGGIEFYGWIFSGYSLAGLASIPRAGREADRHGPLRPLTEQMAVFAVGTLLAGVAPSMPALAAARVIQGYGGGGLYTIAYGIVAKAYPERVRVRVIGLLTLVWVVSGLVGPGLGVLIAGTAGWRWAFLVSLPLVGLAALLTLPALRRRPRDAVAVERLPLRWPLLLAAGVGLLITGLSTLSWWTLPMAASGAVLTVASLRRLLPPGTFTAQAGLPASIALAFLCSLGFFTADAYVTLLLTGVRGRSIGEAGAAVTLVTLSWSAGSWWQSRVMHRHGVATLVRLGGALLAVGVTGTAAALIAAPLWVVYASWLIAGLGMGIAYPTLLVASMDTAAGGDEGSVVAARFVGGRMGMSLGTGLGGVCVSLAALSGASLSAGLGGTFGLAIAASLLSVALARRLRH